MHSGTKGNHSFGLADRFLSLSTGSRWEFVAYLRAPVVWVKVLWLLCVKKKLFRNTAMGRIWWAEEPKLNISTGNRISPKGDVSLYFLSAHKEGQLSPATSDLACIETSSTGHLPMTQASGCPYASETRWRGGPVSKSTAHSQGLHHPLHLKAEAVPLRDSLRMNLREKLIGQQSKGVQMIVSVLQFFIRDGRWERWETVVNEVASTIF